jgi:hypothetical protein
MDSDVSLAFSQVLAMFPYPAPDCSSPRLLLPHHYMLKIYLRFGLAGTLLPSGLLTIAVYAHSLFPICATCLRPSDFLCWHPNNIWQRLQIMSSSLCNFLPPPVAQIDVHKLKFGTFFPYCIRHIFTAFTKSWSRDAILLEVCGMQTQRHILTDHK